MSPIAHLVLSLLLAILCGSVAFAADPLEHSQNRLVAPMASRAAALFQDTDGDLDIDDPNDRDFIRTAVDDRVVAFANHFVENLDVEKLKTSLSQLIEPTIVDGLSPAFWEAFQGLPKLPTDGTWSEQDAANLRKIRSAFMLVSMMEFGAPGKFALFEDPSGTRGGVDTFATEQGGDPEFVKKLKEYEDGWQRLIIVRLLGASTPGPDPAVAGLAAARSLVAGAQNAPSGSIVQAWWSGVLSGPLKPASDIWRINRSWWDLNPNADKVRDRTGQLETAAGSKPTVLSGAQLLSTEARSVRPDKLGTDDLLDRLSTADNWKVKATYESYPDAATVTGGTWSVNGTSMVYTAPGSVGPSSNRTTNVVCARVEMVNDPIELYVLDRSYQVAYGETYPSEDGGPILPARSWVQLLDRMLSAREKPPTNLPAAEGNFQGSSSGGNQSGTFSASVGVGSSF